MNYEYEKFMPFTESLSKYRQKNNNSNDSCVRWSNSMQNFWNVDSSWFVEWSKSWRFAEIEHVIDLEELYMYYIYVAWLLEYTHQYHKYIVFIWLLFLLMKQDIIYWWYTSRNGSNDTHNISQYQPKFLIVIW